ncbi:MAG: tyrosine-type recombinase/integrase [Terriglobales bacterium]
MRRTRYQHGYIYAENGWWYVRYRDHVVQADGSIKRAQIARRLAPRDDQHRTESSVKPLAQDFLADVNAGASKDEPPMTIGQFVETKYLPFVKENKRASTHKGYRHIYENHLQSRIRRKLLRDFKPSDGELLMHTLARVTKLTKMSLRHIKAFLSGVFTHARRYGFLNTGNPMHGVSIPGGRTGEETYAYSLDEITKMLMVLRGSARAVVATAAFTGLRRGELRGLDWADYHDGALHVSRSVWEKHVYEPKTPRSKAPVPVIAQLAGILEEHRLLQGNPSTGRIFRYDDDRGLNLDSLARTYIAPTLKTAGLEWHGWHAFRRGLATNLYELGVQDKIIQAILRHEQLATTTNIYIKARQEKTVAALRDTLERALNQPATVN